MVPAPATAPRPLKVPPSVGDFGGSAWKAHKADRPADQEEEARNGPDQLDLLGELHDLARRPKCDHGAILHRTGDSGSRSLAPVKENNGDVGKDLDLKLPIH